MLTVGVPIKLPDTAANAMPDTQEEPLTISITADGLILIQNTEVADAEMIPKLAAIAAERTDDKIYLRAVSYTHLDVYKRQDPRRPETSGSETLMTSDPTLRPQAQPEDLDLSLIHI